MFERMVQQQMEAIRKERNRETAPNVPAPNTSVPATVSSTLDEKSTPPPVPGPPAAQSTIVNNVTPPAEVEAPVVTSDEQV